MSQEIGVPALFKAMWVECAPAMFGYAAPAGAPLFGGFAWHEVQFRDVSGEAATWHVVHSGAPGTGDVPVTAWQLPQFAVNVVLSTEKWAVVLNGTGCGAPVPPLWHRVLLKQSGVAPGAGAGGGAIGEFAPFRWQYAHTVAFPVAVVVWTYVSPVRHWEACGEFAVGTWQV